MTNDEAHFFFMTVYCAYEHVACVYFFVSPCHQIISVLRTWTLVLSLDITLTYTVLTLSPCENYYLLFSQELHRAYFCRWL